MDDLLVEQKANGEKLNIILNTWNKTLVGKRTRSFVVGVMKDLTEKWEKYDRIHQELLVMKSTEGSSSSKKDKDYFTAKVFESAYIVYLDVLGDMQEILESPIPANNPIPVNHLTVPRLSIPKFSGNYEDWRSFYDLYTASVHNNESLSAVHKLQMLKSLLEGEAEALLRHFQVTQANYDAAWKTLIDRFDNKRVLVNTQLRKLFSQSVATENSDGIKHLLDTTMEAIHALEGLEIDITNWDPVLIYIVSQRLPAETHSLWEQNLSSTELPKFKTLTHFLEKRFRSLEFQSFDSVSNSQPSKRNKAQSYNVNAGTNKCWLCSNSVHPLKKCPKFLESTPKQRSDIASKRKLCKKCFAYSHRTNECRSSQGCEKCNREHNTLLHWEANNTSNNRSNASSSVNAVSVVAPATVAPNQGCQPSSSSATPSNSVNSVVATMSHDGENFERVLLATALVNVSDSNGSAVVLRALLDNGSQVNLITERAVELLGIQKSHSHVTVSGVGNSNSTKPCSKVNITIYSRTICSASFNIDALIMPTLTKQLPSQMVKINSTILDNIQLADPTYGTPGSIDILLSADIFARILLHDMKKLSPFGPIAQKTKLGWILSGSTTNPNRATCALSFVQQALASTNAQKSTLVSDLLVTTNSGRATCALLSTEMSSASIDLTLRSFWEIENVPTTKPIRDDDAKCIQMYEQSNRRCLDGRYIVSLPFRTQSNYYLGCSRDAALSRFIQLERRFQKQPELFKQYCDTIQEYIDLKHMRKVESKESDHVSIRSDNSISYSCSYLPHHGVVKESSTTTRLRIVFDASAKSKSNFSLNDCLLTGPVIQNSLMTILMRWRRFPIVMKADITKMYRQIWVTDSDSEYQRILWRFNPNDAIVDYRLTTVTFGVSSAPFLAIKTLQQLAHDEQDRFPLAANIVLNDFYVDDLLSGADTVDECMNIQHQLINLLRAGGFPIRKWCSNAPEVIDHLHESDREAIDTSEIRSITALGLKWSPIDDCFSFKNPALSHCDSTKRSLLSEASKLFDPLGWLSPSVVLAKMLFQKLWIAGLEWDDPLPEPIRTDWLTLKANLQNIDRIKLPRWIGTLSRTINTVQLHGFCDASERAYSAVVYLRAERSDGTFVVHLICAKTRVAPVKSISIARLELCGALLLAQLIEYTNGIHPSSKMYAWTDSEIVLAWLNGHPNRWKTFVANRVSEIQSLLPANVWNHVRSADNPADCASRGVQPDLLVEHPLWWSGPKWLSECEEMWPKGKITQQIDTEEEKKSVQVLVVQTNELVAALSYRFSSLSKLLRVTAYIQRWKLKVVSKERLQKWLSPLEIENATLFWIRWSQKDFFSTELRDLKAAKSVHARSKLRSLNPIIGSDGIIRVGGRLANADISYDERHPIILPSKCPFTKLLIRQIHFKTRHGGAQLMLAHLRFKYWLLNARNIVRQQVHNCVRCYRYASRTQTQLMADLPRPRVTECRPFTHTGVDYAGPIEILTQRKPGRRQSTKGYICLFVCFATKAIHIELVSSLSTDSFLSAFNRFSSRRGLPSIMYSDNGTNFVGAAKQLDVDFHRSLNDTFANVIHDISNKGVDWKFIPPSAPHFGGLWEAGVKSTKLHLKRILGNSILTYEEMYTVLTEIECCLNSRPLCPMTNDPSDLTALTPGHFLIGEAILTVPRPNILEINENRLNRFQLLQNLHQTFWKRWRTEYLSRLQQRPKWVSSTPNVQIGDLVLLKDDCSPPSKWALGRIIEIHSGEDERVRVVTVKTATTTIKRPIAKLCLLPSSES